MLPVCTFPSFSQSYLGDVFGCIICHFQMFPEKPTACASPHNVEGIDGKTAGKENSHKKGQKEGEAEES